MNFEQIDILSIEETDDEYQNLIMGNNKSLISGYWKCTCYEGIYRGVRYAYASYGNGGSCYNYGYYIINEQSEICHGPGTCCTG